MNKILKGLMVVGLFLSAQTTFAASLFNVYVRPDVDVFSVKTNAASKGWQTQFRIQCTVKNTSKTTQEFGMWTCSYWENWKTNNSRVTIPPWTCHINFLSNASIQPGRTSTSKFSLDISPSLIGKEVRFKIAFVPFKKVNDKNDTPKTMGTYWSNEIKIKVVE